MPPVLRALPYSALGSSVLVREAAVPVRPHQIIVWVGVTPAGATTPPPDDRRFPAILDTGHNATFAITPDHLSAWAGIEWPELELEYGYEPAYHGVRVPHRRANVWLYPNQYGWRDFIDPTARPLLLELHRGLAVFGNRVWLGTRGSEHLDGPRLPILGMEALAIAGVRLRIDTRELSVWLETD